MANTTANKKNNGGRKPKYDYTSPDFLAMVADYAKRGFTDGEIALAIGLSPTAFSSKKSELNELNEALSRARAQVNGIVRAAFLKTAIGGRMVRSVRYVEARCECGGDKDCPRCNGTGWIPDGERQITETELAPNLAAQERWLMNYDADWLRRVSGEQQDDDTIAGFDIKVSFNNMKDLELQERLTPTSDETDN